MTPPDRKFMLRALELAALARGMTRPNPCVGAVIVSPEGAVLGEGFHHRAGLPHAEVEALEAARVAGNEVRGATMYVTLEPCNHRGRTGPCSEAVIAAGIRRVVMAMRDPNAEARGGVERLREAGVEVAVGLCEAEALLLNPAFNTCHMLGRPLVTLKWAMTLDGCTSVGTGDSKWITGPEAREEVHRRRAGHDAVIAGIGTVLRDDARLSARVPGGVSFPPDRIVLDSTLRLSTLSAFVREEDGGRALVVCTEEAEAGREIALQEAGVEVLRLPRGKHGVSIPDLMRALHGRKVQSLYVEGGRILAGQLLEEGVVDRVEAWLAPKLAGGGAGHLGPTLMGNPLGTMAEAISLHHVSAVAFGGDLLVEGWQSSHLFRAG
jgi:diaminohydroxyphosphoribosylaminopyrimidine deaminase/5-amino-6-(5-phosphoribosylamino)uracil reductase